MKAARSRGERDGAGSAHGERGWEDRRNAPRISPA